MSAITAKARRKMKKYAVLTREPRCFLGSFDFSWEQRKLGELVDRVVRKNTNNESTLPLTISAQYGLVDQITYFNNRVASRDVSNYYLVLNGEFAYNKSTSDGYPFGAVKRLDLYEKGVLSTLYIVFAPKKEQQIDSDYLTVFFDTDRWHKGVAERAAEGARNHGLLNISAEDFFDIDLSVPKDIVEQKQIGAFIRQLDNLITLHQRKFEKLTNVKKSMLEKMFPQNGSSYPEIRFKGFTDPWEQRKWINTVDISTNMVDPKSGKYDLLPHVAPGNIESFTGRLYDNVKLVGEENLISGKFVFNVGDIVYGKINPQLGKYVFARFSGLTSADAYVLNAKNGIVQKFLYAVIQTRDFYDYSVSVSKRSGMPKINRDELNAYSYWAPSESEQLKIGEYLLTLDHLITLHQRELKKLQNIKKSMLEKMFV